MISLRGTRPDDVRQGRSADSVLHAAVGRRRIDRCAASAAGASATRTACCSRRSGASWSTASRHRVLLRRRKGRRAHGGPRLRRAEERLRLRRPFPRPVRHAAAHRGGQEPRRPVASSSRRPPSSEADCHAHIIASLTCASRRLPAARRSAALGSSPARVSTQGPHFYPDDPIAREPESQDASKAQPYDHRHDVRDDVQPVRHLRLQAVGPARARTSTRSTKCRTRAGSRTGSARRRSRPRRSRAARIVGAPPDPSRWVLTREKTSGAHPGFTARDAKGETWFLEFDPPYFPEGATGAVAVATKIFWALGYNQVESFLTTFDPEAGDDRPEGDDSPPERQADAVHAATT